MVNKIFICPNGHRWQDDEHDRCPVCGAEAADTVGNGSEQHESTEDGSSKLLHIKTDEPPTSRFGRYEVSQELGRGGMGIVYRAFDPLHEREVALKTLPTTDATSLSRFKREFRVLAEVDHPNIVKLFELTSDGENWYFTMELINGIELINQVDEGTSAGSNSPLALSIAEHDQTLALDQQQFELSAEKVFRIRDGFSQLVEAIAALHANGIVHRDIKPSNVLVTPEGRVVLLDFGLVAETDPSGVHLSLHQQLMGTASYMSPEQAACEAVTSASDWYSVGVMLYQSLTGRLPFTGKVVDVLINKQRQDPVPPRSLVSSVSPEWNDLCMDLLCRNPEGRPRAEDVLERLGSANERSTPTAVSSTGEVALIGRESQLEMLHEARRAVQGGQASCVFVEGASGNGKSALVETFVEQAKHEGAVVLKSRCYEMESVPFKAIDSLVDTLVEHLRHLPSADAAALMPRDVHALARLFPVLGQVKAVAMLPRRETDISDQQELNRRAIGALRELLARMGDRCLLVVFIDDLQWGDEDSAAMLSDLLQPPDSPVLLFLGTYRSEDADSSQFLQSFRLIQLQREVPLDFVLLKVLPLALSDAVNLAMTLLKRDDEKSRRSAESIANEAAGNPFFVSELVKHFQLDGDRDSDSTESLGLFEMIWSRVQRLPDESQRLLAVVALWGQPLPLERAMQIADVGQSAVGPLRTGHLIRTVGAGASQKIETYHDRVRESVSISLTETVKQQHHLRIAEHHARRSNLNADEFLNHLQVCSKDGSNRMDHIEVDAAWYDIAFHFDATGRPDLAFSYALATAEKSREQFSLEMAEQQYRIAERGVEIHDGSIRYRVAEGLGDVLMQRGNYPDAASRFETARKLVVNTDAQARIGGKIGELAFKCGDNKTASDAFEQSLRLLGRKIPSRSAGFLLFLVWEVLVQILHTLFPKWFLARLTTDGAREELLTIDLHAHLARVYFFDRGVIPCLWTHLHSVNLAEKYTPTLELAHAWASHAPVMSLIPWVRRGEAFAQRSLEIRENLGDVCGQGQSLHYWGVVLFVGTRFDQCIGKCRRAVSLLERAGDYWELNVARYSIANSLYRKGDLPKAIAESKRLYEAASKMGDDKAAAFSLEVWSRASGGKLPVDLLHNAMELERNDVQATAQVLLAEGVRLVGAGELRDAEKVLTRAREVCRKVGMMNAWVSPVLSWLTMTLRLQRQRSMGDDPRRNRKLLLDAHRASVQALKIAGKFQTDLPHALREAGLIAVLRGSPRHARRYLDRSLEVAKRQGASFEHAQSLLARGMTGQKLHWPGADEDVAVAKQELTKLGAEFALEYIAAPVRGQMV